MALTVNQKEPNLKHFCKICKKGFGCGRALGGHMRAHGIGDESWNLDDDEDAASDWEEKYGGGSGGNELPSTKRTYALRTNPKKSCRVCEHESCTSDEHVESSPVSPWMSDGDDDGDGERDCGGSKRKRSSRAKVGTFNSTYPSSEEDMAAYCLMMLSNSNVGYLAITAAAAEPEESSASACRDEERRNPNFIPPISYCVPAVVDHKAKSMAVSKGLFECKACKKIFNSHQALGGHRASHKKVKGCFASRLDNLEDKDDDVITHEEFLSTKSNSITHKDHHQNNSTLLMVSSSSKRKSKVHECSICNRTFSSGQALGGHKRCHWITPNTPDSSTLARFQHFQNQMERINQIPKFDNLEPPDLKLELNLPAPANNPAQRNLATDIFLQPWLGGTIETNENQSSNINNNNSYSQCHSPSNRELPLRETKNDKNQEDNNNNNYRTVSRENVEDEADSKVKKLAKLSELKDMNMGGSSSPWLQVGIGSTTGVGAEP